MADLHLRVNGRAITVVAAPMARLLDVLREQLLLTGTKEGCGEGECGACAVRYNGALANTCLIPALEADGADITTVEGLGAPDGTLSTIQQAFLEHGGAQCGICTPGMLIAAHDLLSRIAEPTEQDIRVGLAGNLCRCTGYMKIFESVVRAVQAERALARGGGQP